VFFSLPCDLLSTSSAVIHPSIHPKKKKKNLLTKHSRRKKKSEELRFGWHGSVGRRHAAELQQPVAAKEQGRNQGQEDDAQGLPRSHHLHLRHRYALFSCNSEIARSHQEIRSIPLSCAAGLFLGAVTGGLIGLATESGLFRGTGIGAITGALVSIEVVDSSIRVWRSRRSGIWSILYVVSA
jgi:hypothetical protein